MITVLIVLLVMMVYMVEYVMETSELRNSNIANNDTLKGHVIIFLVS